MGWMGEMGVCSQSVCKLLFKPPTKIVASLSIVKNYPLFKHQYHLRHQLTILKTITDQTQIPKDKRKKTINYSKLFIFSTPTQSNSNPFTQT
jgi:hypothetical protein